MDWKCPCLQREEHKPRNKDQKLTWKLAEIDMEVCGVFMCLRQARVRGTELQAWRSGCQGPLSSGSYGSVILKVYIPVFSIIFFAVAEFHMCSFYNPSFFWKSRCSCHTLSSCSSVSENKKGSKKGPLFKELNVGLLTTQSQTCRLERNQHHEKPCVWSADHPKFLCLLKCVNLEFPP